MHKELKTIEVIRGYLESNALLNNDINGIYDIYDQLIGIIGSSNGVIKKFNSLYIINYIREYIANDEVAKRKTSARVFEDLLAILFKGEVTDNKSRKNLSFDVPDYFIHTKDKIAGNKREKIDILFRRADSSPFGISVKTLMFDNYEINMGSFEKKVLFDGFEVSEYLNERKTEDKEKKGLGSSSQLRNLLLQIERNEKYNEFKDRFINMFNYVFHDDLLILIKNTASVDIYFLKGVEVCKFFCEKVQSIEDFTSIVNRWEGNSIRIDRRPLLDSCTNKRITLDLSILNTTVIDSINKFDIKLHESYVRYFNETDGEYYKKDRESIIGELSTIFNEFDAQFVELC